MHSHQGLIAPVLASLKLREMWTDFFPSPKRIRRWLRVLFRYGMRLLRAAGRQQVFLCTMAFHTISGLEAMLQALLMGDRLVLLPRFHPTRALEAVQRERVSILIGVPLSYLAMMRHRDFDRYRLSSLLICATGAAPCPPKLAREIRERFRCAVHIGFGMTELGGGIAATSLEDSASRQTETVGKAMPGFAVRIVDDNHQPLPPGQVGELACRGEGHMLGYFGERHNFGEIMDAQGWLYTGDLAVMDEEGFIRIVGRKKDMIIRGGQNIYPVKLESILGSMEKIREAAVVGVPDALGGESVWVFVIPEEGSPLSESEVLAYCRANLEVYEIPQQVRIRSDFPRAESGKARKFQLRELAMEERGLHG
jgi:acyl-CoA synthetase (AMP-forming)/AMP-acid ligase II